MSSVFQPEFDRASGFRDIIHTAFISAAQAVDLGVAGVLLGGADRGRGRLNLHVADAPVRQT